jgi:hypothetical protein
MNRKTSKFNILTSPKPNFIKSEIRKPRKEQIKEKRKEEKKTKEKKTNKFFTFETSTHTHLLPRVVYLSFHAIPLHRKAKLAFKAF